MPRRALAVAAALIGLIVLTTVGTSAVFASTSLAKWPPWLSIESPVDPFDPSTRDAVLLVHTMFRDGNAQLSDLSGSAEGVVNGKRQSIPLRFEATSHSNVFALRRQWPADGAWVLRISLRTTTALVALDRTGAVASVHVPTSASSQGPLPRAVGARDVDSALAAVAEVPRR